MLPESFACFLVRRPDSEGIRSGIERLPVRDLPPGTVVIQVQRSSINYKDALAATGHPGIVRNFPHVPGIDAAGIVVDSSDPRFRRGDAVFTTGHELGVERFGGWAELIRVPGDWILPLPDSLTVDEVMALGTAGFTAAQCVESLLHHGIAADRGEVVVTGATGGVGSLAIRILARLKYSVVAVSGKPEQTGWLLSLGAARVISRHELLKAPDRPLLTAQFAGAIDTVGGSLLASLLRSIHHRGCAACCGVAGGADLKTTVYPFILRGITLSGIDSAWCPDALRPGLWQKLATRWKPEQLLSGVRTVRLSEAGEIVKSMLAGRTTGRTLINPELSG